MVNVHWRSAGSIARDIQVSGFKKPPRKYLEVIGVQGIFQKTFPAAAAGVAGGPEKTWAPMQHSTQSSLLKSEARPSLLFCTSMVNVHWRSAGSIARDIQVSGFKKPPRKYLEVIGVQGIFQKTFPCLPHLLRQC